MSAKADPHQLTAGFFSETLRLEKQQHNEKF